MFGLMFGGIKWSIGWFHAIRRAFLLRLGAQEVERTILDPFRENAVFRQIDIRSASCASAGSRLLVCVWGVYWWMHACVCVCVCVCVCIHFNLIIWSRTAGCPSYEGLFTQGAHTDQPSTTSVESDTPLKPPSIVWDPFWTLLQISLFWMCFYDINCSLLY